jgi:hypothetical protein
MQFPGWRSQIKDATIIGRITSEEFTVTRRRDLWIRHFLQPVAGCSCRCSSLRLICADRVVAQANSKTCGEVYKITYHEDFTK